MCSWEWCRKEEQTRPSTSYYKHQPLHREEIGSFNWRHSELSNYLKLWVFSLHEVFDCIYIVLTLSRKSFQRRNASNENFVTPQNGDSQTQIPNNIRHLILQTEISNNGQYLVRLAPNAERPSEGMLISPTKHSCAADAPTLPSCTHAVRGAITELNYQPPKIEWGEWSKGRWGCSDVMGSWTCWWEIIMQSVGTKTFD